MNKSNNNLVTTNKNNPLQSRHPGGRPSTYKKKYSIIANDYLHELESTYEIPYIEKLAIKLGIHRETILEWENKKNEDGSLQYPEFSDTIKKLKDIQRLRLQELALLNKVNPTVAIFLMKVNHNMIETEIQKHDGELKFKVVRGE